MKKAQAINLKDVQAVDIRLQLDYQEAHVKNSLNLNPKNFNKYATDFLSLNEPVVFITGEDDKEGLEEIEKAAKEFGFTQLMGYLTINDVPAELLVSSPTISAEEFLQKEDFILLDVRHPDEITRPAPKKNLVNIPLEDLTEKQASLDPDKEIYTLCGSGNRGTSAASYLTSQGFNAIVIEGGMKAVQEASEK